MTSQLRKNRIGNRLAGLPTEAYADLSSLAELGESLINATVTTTTVVEMLEENWDRPLRRVVRGRKVGLTSARTVSGIQDLWNRQIEPLHDQIVYPGEAGPVLGQGRVLQKNVRFNRPSLELLLDQFRSARDGRAVSELITSIQAISDTALMEHLLQILRDESTSPVARWGILEFLTTRGCPGLLPIVLEHVSRQQFGPFLDGCTIALRVLTIPKDQRPFVADLMRSQALALSKGGCAPQALKRNLFGDTLLVLGSHGNENDVSLLLRYLDSDWGYVDSFDHITEAIRRLLVRKAERVREDDMQRLRERLQSLLSAFGNPLVLNAERGNFHRVACIVRVLCARLSSSETELAYQAVVKSQHVSLATLMAQYIRETETDLRTIGMDAWLERQQAHAMEMYCKLETLKQGLMNSNTSGE